MKKQIRRVLALCLALCLPVMSAQALEVTDWLTAVCCYPEGSTEADATYVYRYSLPVFGGDEEAVEAINEVYAYEAEYIETFTVPINGDMYGTGSTQYFTELTTEVTCLSEDFLSVKLMYSEHTDEGSQTSHVAGHVFALKGSKAGTVISLPYMLGVLDMDEDDEWLTERQTNKCDTCVRGLVWEQLQELADDGTLELYDDADEEYFEGVFYPEEDFYLTEDGSVTFFLQPDTVCPEKYGTLTFTFTVEDLLDEL